mmetsp:Transcript_4623/g.9631  ORF Transcript_4623/g.9631 Transcript_4623/m.9631 type:complete len:91 (+) Transcript_4623:1212-1484(+)
MHRKNYSPTGAQRPQFVSRAAAAVERINVLFPLIFGAVRRNIPSSSNEFDIEFDLSIQYGHRPRNIPAESLPMSSNTVAIFHPRALEFAA